MAKELEEKGIYYCEKCKLMYKNKKMAEKCEKWCMENNSCNIKITKYAINNKKGGENG